MTDRRSALVIVVFLFAAVAACLYFDKPPAPARPDAPLTQFSAARALVHLNQFATAPHPIGSVEHDRVRDYLVAQLTALGLAPEIQKTTAVVPRYQAAGTVENIVTRSKGTGGNSDAVLLLAHYDSVPAGPGAGDDGAGVAAWLEAFRALRTGPALRNDVILLFTDGEEAGLLGAAAFIAEHPWAKDVRVVVNVEARGNAGVSQLFETSRNNGRLVQTVAQAVPHPVGTSLTYEIYQHMPNDTDMTLFKRADDAGLNFAFIGNWEAYHTPLDNPQLLDKGSLQHHGENILSVVRVLGDADLTHLDQRDALFFGLAPGVFAHYSTKWDWPLVILAAAMFIAAVFFAKSSLGAGWGGIAGGFFLTLGLIVICILGGFCFVRVVQWLHLHIFAEGSTLQSIPYLASMFGLMAALVTASYLWLRKKSTGAAVSLGGFLVALLALLATAQWLAGGSYVFLWPLLAALLATAAVAFRLEKVSSSSQALLCLLSLPALFIFIPIFKGFFLALGLTPIGAPALGLVFVFCFVLLLPLMDALVTAGGRTVPLGALGLALILFVVGAASTRYSDAHPKPTMMAYALDADSGKPVWASTAARLDSWTAQYVGSSPASGKLSGFYPDWLPIDFLQNAAPALNIAAPEAQLLDASNNADGRALHLRITSPRHARSLQISVKEGKVLEAMVNGHSLGKPSEARWNLGGWSFDYSNAQDEGIDVVLKVQGNAPVRVAVTDKSAGFPAIPGATLAPRPADSMPFQWGDTTMVKRTFVF